MNTQTLALTVGLTVYLVGGLSTASHAETVSKTVKEWTAQIEASEATATPVLITNIRLDRIQGRLQVILETSTGSLVPTTREAGNSLIIEIPNAVLSLATGNEFRAEKPLEGISSIVALQSGVSNVQIAIAGTTAITDLDGPTHTRLAMCRSRSLERQPFQCWKLFPVKLACN